MNKINKCYSFHISTLAFLCLIILFVGYSSINEVSAQALSESNQKSKTIKEIAQERDVEIGEKSCGSEWEYDLEKHSNSEAIVYGRITKIETTLDGNSLYTTYTTETQRIIKQFVSNVPLEAYYVMNRPLPELIGGEFKTIRHGGLLFVNGHRVREKVPGYDDLVENQNYIFFLTWSSAYKAYTLAGGVSGVVLIQDDLQIKPLATDEKVKQSNEKFLKGSKNLEDFLQNLKLINYLSPL